MRFKLTDILESTILLEGRLEDVKAKYPGNDELIDRLSQNDPSDNNKYLEWMTKQVMGKGRDEGIPMADKVIQMVDKFHISGDRLKKQDFPLDLNQYKSVQQLEDTFNKLSRRDAPSKKDLKGSGELVYDGPKLYILAPRNYEGSCKWGSGAKWCIASDTTDSHWKSYTKNNLFYFVISKTLPSSDDRYKVAIEKNLKTNKNTYWDVPDHSSPTPQNPDITPEVLAVVDKHAIVAKKHVLKKLVEDMVSGVKSTLNFDNIMKTKEILNDGQLYKILMNDLMVFNQRGGYGSDSTINLFEYTVGRIGEGEMMKLLKTNYDNFAKLLGNEKILDWVDGNTDRPQKLELANALKGHLKTVSPNVRTKIQKWGMTDEAWAKYESESQYVFLGNPDSGKPVGEIYKVDKFDPKSYDIISQLKLKLKYKDVGLYGAITGKDELDNYMGGTEVPDEVMGGIKLQKIA
tara:strand:- start:1963 stop:3342 length:1380 start_codon:yes stop_codon:yes gene_type:complete